MTRVRIHHRTYNTKAEAIVATVPVEAIVAERDQLRADIIEWQRVNLELYHAIRPIDGETLLGAARTLRNEIDALKESILVQQIFSDDRIRANEAEAELAAEREKVRVLREAMKFIANDDNYIDPQFNPCELASEALTATKETK